MTQEEEEAIRVWASAIPDDDGAGEAAGSSEFNDEKTNNNSTSGADRLRRRGVKLAIPSFTTKKGYRRWFCWHVRV